eukprot:3461969-Rhodomonas_salina.3
MLILQPRGLAELGVWAWHWFSTRGTTPAPRSAYLAACRRSCGTRTCTHARPVSQQLQRKRKSAGDVSLEACESGGVEKLLGLSLR